MPDREPEPLNQKQLEDQVWIAAFGAAFAHESHMGLGIPDISYGAVEVANKAVIAFRHAQKERRDSMLKELKTGRPPPRLTDAGVCIPTTPVANGLPTEPGWYVFINDNGTPELLNLNPNHWNETKGWNDNFMGVTPDAPDCGYTHFCRIVIPESR